MTLVLATNLQKAMLVLTNTLFKITLTMIKRMHTVRVFLGFDMIIRYIYPYYPVLLGQPEAPEPHKSHKVDGITTEKITYNKTISWWHHQMETFSALLAICAGNSLVPGEFPTQRPVTRSFDVFFDLRLNKRLRLVIRDAIAPIMTPS